MMESVASGKSTETAEGESPSGEDARHPQEDFLEKRSRPEIGRNAPQPVNIFTRIRTILKNKLFKQCRQDGLEA